MTGLISIVLILNATRTTKNGLLSHTSLLFILHNLNHFTKHLHTHPGHSSSSYNTAPLNLFCYQNRLSLHFLLPVVVADLNRLPHVVFPITMIFHYLGCNRPSLLHMCILCPLNCLLEYGCMAGGEDSLPTTFMQKGNTYVHFVKNTRSDSNLAPTKNEGSSSTTENFLSGSTPTHSLSKNTTNEHQTFDGARDKSDSSAIETSNEVESEKTETADETGGTYERLESLATENLGETGQDLIDPSDMSIPLEYKEIGMDLETHPKIQTERSNTEDTTAE